MITSNFRWSTLYHSRFVPFKANRDPATAQHLAPVTRPDRTGLWCQVSSDCASPTARVLPYLYPRPTLSRARRTEIIPITGLERRVEKTRTCCRRAGYKEPRCFSCSWSGSTLPLHHHPAVERRYSVNQCAEQCSAPPAPRHMHTAAPYSKQAHRRLQERWESEGRREGGVGVWEDKEWVRFLAFLND